VSALHGLTILWLGSDFEIGAAALQSLAARVFLRTTNKRLRLRPAPLVRLNLENEYPRAYVTSRVGKMTGKLTDAHYITGLLPSRTVAEKFMNAPSTCSRCVAAPLIWSLTQIFPRRCAKQKARNIVSVQSTAGHLAHSWEVT